jgi:hypothetical protein
MAFGDQCFHHALSVLLEHESQQATENRLLHRSNRRLRQRVKDLEEQVLSLTMRLGQREEEDRNTHPDWKECPQCGEPIRRWVDGELQCRDCDG